MPPFLTPLGAFMRPSSASGSPWKPSRLCRLSCRLPSLTAFYFQFQQFSIFMCFCLEMSIRPVMCDRGVRFAHDRPADWSKAAH